jgi:hypothetical protein
MRLVNACTGRGTYFSKAHINPSSTASAASKNNVMAQSIYFFFKNRLA